MNSRVQLVVGGILAAVLIAVGGYYLYRDAAPVAPAPLAGAPSLEDVSTITELPLPSVDAPRLPMPMPDLGRPFSFGAEFSPEAQSLMREKMAALVANLNADPEDFSSWINLGIRRKAVRDFEGARQAFEYAARLQPENYLPPYNLGVLSHYFLKDFQNAERHFLRALELFPSNAPTYGELADLYRYSYKQDTTAAVDTLKRGLAATGDDANLLVKLAVYYRDVASDSANARRYFGEAKDAAVKAGNVELASALAEELAARK